MFATFERHQSTVSVSSGAGIGVRQTRRLIFLLVILVGLIGNAQTARSAGNNQDRILNRTEVAPKSEDTLIYPKEAPHPSGTPHPSQTPHITPTLTPHPSGTPHPSETPHMTPTPTHPAVATGIFPAAEFPNC